ncbi:MAG TPA: response regulator transcription factor [Leptospiraceae bacterium]|nr:response regulator transcription factor [Leptospiraceae bacterium]HMY67801.1 response regulator transcription factor [Leptospiraceae bacterium]HMZ58191.1 response regulator transcription factor [Leptospiraceae bacterium]HNF27555.1 response regulator transcription factor [Leptospiraceae bacterium]HNI97424.1 response regulator transcription factor [Leptospiraceae bacterium]
MTFLSDAEMVYGIVDDSEEFSSVLAGLLKMKKATKEVIRFASAEAALESPLLPNLNFLFIDYRLNGMDGISFLRQKQIRKMKIPKLILSGFNAEEKIFEALKYGISGYMFKEELHSLDSVLEIILSGGAFLSPTIAFRIINHFHADDEHRETKPLSPRELEILDRLCDGLSAQEIADFFNISVHTVRVHVKNIYAKMEVSSYRQLVARMDKG